MPSIGLRHIYITILNNYEDIFDTAISTTDKSLGFDTNIINLLLLFGAKDINTFT